tara:strand:- start:13 stop:1107 length:1095 start_codon:yes stop_codon:yes gene_type:complete
MRSESHANNAFHNLIIHMNGDTRQISPDNGNKIIVDNDLTITRGILAMGQNHALEVSGDVVIDDASDTAVLEMGISSNISSQAATFGSLTIGNNGTYKATSGTTTLNGTVDVGMRVDGTFTNNDGTFVIAGSITKVQMGSIGGAPTGFSINNAPFHHLTINDSINFAWSTGTLFNVEGDLTVAAGQTLGANNENSGIKVLGDVTLNGTLGNSFLTNDCEFKSLTINSGGTYSATTGTTTITGESGSGVNLSNSGTFTHNQGTVKVTCATQTSLVGFNGTNGFYNYTFAGTGSGQDQVCGGNTDFFGHVIIDSANSEVQMQAHTFNLYGGITIKQGGWDIGSSDTSGTVNVYGLVRNVGGTVVAS